MTNDEKLVRVTVLKLRPENSETYHLEASLLDRHSYINKGFSGVMYGYFSDISFGASKFTPIKRIGYARFSLKDRLKEKEEPIEHNALLGTVSTNYGIGIESHFRLVIACNEELMVAIENAYKNEKVVTVLMVLGEWEKSEYTEEWINFANVDHIDIDEITPLKLEEYKAQMKYEIKSHLSKESCGDIHDGQIYTICEEFSEAFSNEEIYQKKEEIIPEIERLISSLKWTLQIEKSEIRRQIEEDDDLELCKLFNLTGEEFLIQAEKLKNKKEYRKIWHEYNTLHKRIKATKIFTDGYPFNNYEFSLLAEEYLKIKGINSPTLNEILIEGLILTDIANTAWELKGKGLISSEAILSIEQGYYVFESKKLNSIVKAFSSGLRVMDQLGSIEEFNFNLLKDMCFLHSRSEHMNKELLLHLLYRIEERGVAMNPYIYKILERL